MGSEAIMVWGSRLHCIHSQKAKRGNNGDQLTFSLYQSRTSARGMVPPTFRMGFGSLLKPSWKSPDKHSQMCVSQVDKQDWPHRVWGVVPLRDWEYSLSSLRQSRTVPLGNQDLNTVGKTGQWTWPSEPNRLASNACLVYTVAMNS